MNRVHKLVKLILGDSDTDVSTANPLPTTDSGLAASIGDPTDAAVTNPASDATANSLLKGALSGGISQPTTARSISYTGTSANVALTSSCVRVSMYSTTGCFYALGDNTVEADSSDHYIGAGERLDIRVPASTYIAAIQETSAGTLYISELV